MAISGVATAGRRARVAGKGRVGRLAGARAAARERATRPRANAAAAEARPAASGTTEPTAARSSAWTATLRPGQRGSTPAPDGAIIALPATPRSCPAEPLRGVVQMATDLTTAYRAPITARRMATAAAEFLGALSEPERAVASFPFDGDERYEWNYTPVLRNGLLLKQMGPEQRRAAHALLETG